MFPRHFFFIVDIEKTSILWYNQAIIILHTNIMPIKKTVKKVAKKLTKKQEKKQLFKVVRIGKEDIIFPSEEEAILFSSSQPGSRVESCL